MYKKLAITTLASTLAFVIVITLFDQFFGKTLYGVGTFLLERNEWVAVFGTFLISAICIVPIPDHAISVLAWIGGLGTMENIAYSTAGSTLGASIAFGLGGALGRVEILNKLLSRHKEKSEELLVKFGATGIIIACATPFPYSPICWLAGMLGFDFLKFLVIVIVFRAIKVTYVLLLAQHGIMFF